MHTKNVNRLSCPTMLKRLSVYCCALGLKELNDLDPISKKKPVHILQIFFLNYDKAKRNKNNNFKVVLYRFSLEIQRSNLRIMIYIVLNY